ncbi:hypothetical protein ArsFIN_13300 [Arsenophonus nasoniae]|uniref:Uncharacterized protein n=1 Tax=Arsenophonus nasoniae TaxID=638 RepID=A0A4P7KS66_9GAMM|nr:hypothetical protein ArsFIN_13300 [Arsenophonus nasoniae]
MGQVAFDTQEFVETLENAGLPKESKSNFYCCT